MAARDILDMSEEEIQKMVRVDGQLETYVALVSGNDWPERERGETYQAWPERVSRLGCASQMADEDLEAWITALVAERNRRRSSLRPERKLCWPYVSHSELLDQVLAGAREAIDEHYSFKHPEFSDRLEAVAAEANPILEQLGWVEVPPLQDLVACGPAMYVGMECCSTPDRLIGREISPSDLLQEHEAHCKCRTMIGGQTFPGTQLEVFHRPSRTVLEHVYYANSKERFVVLCEPGKDMERVDGLDIQIRVRR